MKKKLFKKYDYDISLDEGVGNHLISWITGLMVFFVTLTLATNIGLSSVTKSWVSGLSGTLTIEVRPPISSSESDTVIARDKQKFKNTIKQIMTMLRNRSDISEARLLADNEIRKLIEPWMGSNIALETIPLPSLIDVKLNDKSNISELELELKKIEPSASVDNHTETKEDIKTLVKTANSFVSLLTSVIIALAIISIAGIVRSKLMIHKSEVETLHLIGASDEYIAKQFRHHTLRNTIKGSVAGLLTTLVILLIIGTVTKTLNTDLFSYIKIMPFEWLSLFIAPILIGSMIAHLTAQATVLKELSKLS